MDSGLVAVAADKENDLLMELKNILISEGEKTTSHLYEFFLKGHRFAGFYGDFCSCSAVTSSFLGIIDLSYVIICPCCIVLFFIRGGITMFQICLFVIFSILIYFLIGLAYAVVSKIIQYFYVRRYNNFKNRILDIEDPEDVSIYLKMHKKNMFSMVYGPYDVVDKRMNQDIPAYVDRMYEILKQLS